MLLAVSSTSQAQDFIFSGQQSDVDNVDEVVSLIKKLPDWPKLSAASLPEHDECARLDAQELERIAQRISKYDVKTLRTAFERYERLTFENLNYSRSSLFILNNYLFAIPAGVRRDSKHFRYVVSGWRGLPLTGDVQNPKPGDIVSSRWPWEEKDDGSYRFIVERKAVIYKGAAYRALERFDYFLTEFGLRLSPRTKVDFRNYTILDKFISGPDVETAIFAAWERLSREAKDNANKSAAIERFLGFLEGRLRVSIPIGWEKKVREVDFKEDGLPRFRSVEIPFHGSGIGTTITPGYELRMKNGTLHLTGNKIDIPLIGFDKNTNSIRLSEKRQEHCGPLAVGDVDGQDAILGFCGNAPFPFPLVRIDQQGKVAWETMVKCCASYQKLDVVGFDSAMSTEIGVGESTVVLFGEHFQVLFIVGFDLEDGECIFQFSTHDWESRSSGRKSISNTNKPPPTANFLRMGERSDSKGCHGPKRRNWASVGFRRLQMNIIIDGPPSGERKPLGLSPRQLR